MSGNKTITQLMRLLMKPITIKLDLKPVPASRPRIPRFGKAYFPKTYSKWRSDAHRIVAEVTNQLAIPLVADCLFAIPRAKTSKLIVPWGDGDNFEKALYDFIVRKGFLQDDKWITTGHWRKRFLPHGCVGYTLITLTKEMEEIDIEYETKGNGFRNRGDMF